MGCHKSRWAQQGWGWDWGWGWWAAQQAPAPEWQGTRRAAGTGPPLAQRVRAAGKAPLPAAAPQPLGRLGWAGRQWYPLALALSPQQRAKVGQAAPQQQAKQAQAPQQGETGWAAPRQVERRRAAPPLQAREAQAHRWLARLVSGAPPSLVKLEPGLQPRGRLELAVPQRERESQAAEQWETLGRAAPQQLGRRRAVPLEERRWAAPPGERAQPALRQKERWLASQRAERRVCRRSSRRIGRTSRQPTAGRTALASAEGE